MKKTTTATTNETVNQENTVEQKIRTRTCVEPLTREEANELQEYLLKHNMCIKDAKKNIRVYRYLGHKKGKIIASPDFVYVVGADAYRENKKKVFADILALSKQVMNSHRMVKNKEYVAKMARVEEDLLINHAVHMVWTKSKTVRFLKFNHVITDPGVLSPLNEFAKGKTDHLVTNRIYETKDGKHLKIFQRMAQVFEEFDPTIPFYDWHSFRYITKNGKVVAAYSTADMKDKVVVHFKKGIQDKFDYNLNVMDDKYIADVVAKLEGMKAAEMAEMDA